jgi:hypothetical protein
MSNHGPDNRHRIDLPFWARPGFSTMAKADDQGGGGDDEEEDDKDDEEEDEEDEDDPDAGKTDAELRAELKAVRDSLTKANGQSKARRLQLKQKDAQLTAALAKKPAAKKPDADDEKPDIEQIKAQAKLEAKAESDTRTVKAEARGALRGLGVPADQISAIAGMLDLSDVTVDDDGEVDGIDDALGDLQRKFPQLFPKTRKKGSVAGANDRGGQGSAGRKPVAKSASEVQAAIMRGEKV